MKVRAISGFFFLVIVIGAIVFSAWSMAFLFLIISLIGLNEFYNLTETKEQSPNGILGLFLGIIVYTLLFFVSINQIETDFLALSFIGFSIIGGLELLRKKKNPIGNIAITVFSIIYIVIPFGLLSFIANHSGSYSFQIPLGILIIIWTGDTFAYLVGRQFGKHKLLERVSPKKTWEGYFGGVVFSILAGYLLSIFYSDLSFSQWLTVALIIGLLGTAGDLIESMLKRSAGVKDSGNLMPGHGGVLDRFDSLLFVVPFVLFYLSVWVW